MKKKIQQLRKEIENFGIQLSLEERDYVEVKLKSAYFEGKIAGIKKAFEMMNKK